MPHQRQLDAIRGNPDGDQVLSLFQPLAAKILSPHWSSYVLHHQYTTLIEGTGKSRRLLVFAHLNPSLFEGFASVTLMGACFEQSVLSYLWTRMGIKFRPHAAIQKRLRYTQHQNGHLLTIRYAIEESWSKSFRDKPLSGDQKQTVFDHVVKGIRKAVANTEFVWMGNIDVPNDLFAGHGHRLPNSPHGLNPYQHIHHAVIVSALNPRPAHFAFLEALEVQG